MRFFCSRHRPWLSIATLTLACGGEPADDGSNASGGTAGSVSGSSGFSGAGAGSAGASGTTGGTAGATAGAGGTSSTGGAGRGGAAGAAAASGASGAGGGGGTGASAGAPGGMGGALPGGAGGGAGESGTAGTVAGGSGSGGVSGAHGAGAAGTAGDAGAGGGGEQLCADRTGGALIEAEVLGETLRFWTTNAAFIDEAEQSIGDIPERIPLLELEDGRDCDAQWTFHFDAATARFVDEWIDICDVELSRIEGDKSFYLANGDFCPRFMRIDSVTTR